MLIRAIAALVCLGTLSGCVVPADIRMAPSPVPRSIDAGVTPKPVQFRRIVIKVPRGAPMGAGQAGFLCVPRNTLQYTGNTDINDSRFGETFREEFTRANYVVAGNPSDLFEEPSDSGAELVIAGSITDIKLNACIIPTGETKGESALVVEWQIFNRLDRRVVHKVTTRGTGRADTASAGGIGLAIQAAFAQATRGLLADEQFHRLVTGRDSASQSAQGERAPAFQLYARERVANPISSRIADIQSGVVTVFTGRGHGSGFFVSSEGYVLTNSHVVGDGRSVRVKLATGREVPGEVIATNSRRDVALIRTSESGFTALPIARDDLPIGSEVYALGSPFTERLAATLTRGIVSGYRSVDGMRYIQSDVGVQRGNSGGPLTDASGNVVGVTVFGVATRGTTVGLNFFIPIEEALSSVGIERVESSGPTRGRGESRMVRLDPPAPVQAAAAPGREAAAVPAAPARSEMPSYDGKYHAVITSAMFSDLAAFPITIVVQGSLITGSAAAPSIGKSDHICRASGTVGTAGNATFELFCSAMSVDTVKIAHLTGQFAADPGQGNAMMAHMVYQTNEARTGEVVWSRVAP